MFSLIIYLLKVIIINDENFNYFGFLHNCLFFKQDINFTHLIYYYAIIILNYQILACQHSFKLYMFYQFYEPIIFSYFNLLKKILFFCLTYCLNYFNFGFNFINFKQIKAFTIITIISIIVVILSSIFLIHLRILYYIFLKMAQESNHNQILCLFISLH